MIVLNVLTYHSLVMMNQEGRERRYIPYYNNNNNIYNDIIRQKQNN